MVDLAGFDVIGQAHIETVVDLLNQFPVANPIDGKSIYLFGGPFSTDLDVPVGGPVGTVRMRLIVNMELQPVVHQSHVLVVASFKGGASSAVAPGLSDIGGQFTLDVVLSFASPQGAAAGSQFAPVFDVTAFSPVVELDAATRGLVDGALGSGSADGLTAALNTAFGNFLRQAKLFELPIFWFTVAPGVDSHDPTQLSALPVLAWIDKQTLGAFGYFRAAASGGNIAAKNSGDLATANEEFFYNQPGLSSAVPGRRLALLMSADAFEMVIACPAIRKNVVKKLVTNRELPNWKDWVVFKNGDQLRAEANSHFFQYLADETEKHPDSDYTTLLTLAKSDVELEYDAAVNAKAQSDENDWLKSSAPAGPERSPQEVIDQATPPPCGKGSVQIVRMPVEHAQSDFVPMLRRLEVALADGKLTIGYEVGGMLEVITGDVYFDVTGELEVVLAVTGSGQLTLAVTSDPPNVDINATGLTGTVKGLITTLDGGFWRDLMTLLSMILQFEITKAISDAIKRGDIPTVVPVPTPQQPFPTRLVEVTVAPKSLFIATLVCREPRWNDFNPSLMIDASRDSRTQVDNKPVRIVCPATDWGCAAAEFKTTRTFWDETWTVRAALRDAPLPATFHGWQIEVGNFSWNTIGGVRFLDPGPSWSNQPVDLVDGALILDGEVEHLDPLILPYIDGPLTTAQVEVGITASPENGWSIGLRGSDGNFYLHFATDATDGDGKQWHAETFIIHAGEQIDLPPEYIAYEADCDAKAGSALRRRLKSLHLVGVTHVLPGQPVMKGEIREAIAISTLIHAGDPTALAQLAAARERYGDSFTKRVLAVTPLQVGSVAESGRAVALT